MKSTSQFWPALVLSLLAHAAVNAQTPSAAPPQLEKAEELTGAPITVTPKSGSEKKITEKREQGKVTEVKVKSGKSTYYVKPNTPAGSALPGDAAGSANRGPQWPVLEFDLNKKKKTQKEQDAADQVPVPAPPKLAPAS